MKMHINFTVTPQYPWRWIPGPPSDTQIHGCSSPLHKMAQTRANSQSASTDSQLRIKTTAGYKTHRYGGTTIRLSKIFYAITSSTE